MNNFSRMSMNSQPQYYVATDIKGCHYYFSIIVSRHNNAFYADLSVFSMFCPVGPGGNFAHPNFNPVQWILEFGFNDRGSFSNSIMLPVGLRSFGMGTLMVKSLLEEAKHDFGSSPISGSLSWVDSDANPSKIENNSKRRHRFYKALGFNISYKDDEESEGTFTIGTLSSLNTSVLTPHIKKFDSIGKFIFELQRENLEQSKQITPLKERIDVLADDNENLRDELNARGARSVERGFLCVAIILVLGYLALRSGGLV